MNLEKSNRKLSGIQTGLLSSDGIVYLTLGAASLLFLYIFLMNSSPLYDKLCAGDSAYFIMTGRAMLKGAVPYLDFFDIKGPILFFIQALGQFIYPDKLGTFILQIPFFFTSIILLYKTALLFVDRKKALISTVSIFFVIIVTFDNGNLSEEYSLPFIILCIYMAILHLKQGKDENHPPLYAAVYGASFAVIALIRVTNAAAIGAVVLFFTAELLLRKQYKALLYNALMFLLGIVVVTIPVFLYFMSKNALYDMLYCTFIFPAVYAGDGMGIRTIGGWVHALLNASPAVFALFVGVLYYFLKDKKIALVSIAACLFTIIVVCLGYNYLHYFTLTAPLFVIAIAMLFEVFPLMLLPKYRLLTIALIGSLLIVAGYYTFRNMKEIHTKYQVLTEKSYLASNEKIYRFFEAIPEREREQVYFYNVYARVAYLMNISPYYKYSDFQESYVKLDPGIKTEIRTMMQECPPKWVIISDETGKITNEEFLRVLNSEYLEVQQMDSYVLYQRKS